MPIKATIQTLKHDFLQFLSPNYCLLCRDFGFAGSDPWLCEGCEQALPRIQAPICFTCGLPLQSSDSCRACANGDIRLDRHRSLGQFDASMQRLIHAFKYHHNLALINTWMRLLKTDTQIQALIEQACVLCPVPMAPARVKWRGYNHAQLLTQAIAQFWGKPINPMLMRSHVTKQRAKISRNQRTSHEKLPILVKTMSEKYDCVLLVDDVLTTGATLNACCDAIKAAGLANQVFAITLARTL